MTHYALWLLPSSPHSHTLQQRIRAYATAYQLPVFTPHLTLLSGLHAKQQPPRAHGERLLASLPLTVRFSHLEQTPARFRRLFLVAEPNQALERLRQGSLVDGANTPWQPHLSLLYAELSQLDTASVQRLIDQQPSAETLCFDRLAWVNCQGEPNHWFIESEYSPTRQP